METAGNDQFDDDTEKKGLGTPATRAGIIEKLVKSGFAERKGKSLIPTKDGCNLVCVLPEQITSPTMTAEWENTLMEIERGNADADAFLSGIVQMTGDLVKAYPFLSDAEAQRFGTGKEEIGKCPRCGSPVYVGKGNFYCSSKECNFCLWEDNKFFSSKKKKLTKKIAAELLDKGWCRAVSYTHLEIYSLEVEGQKPDGIIEYEEYGRTMYMWYYNDLKSNKSCLLYTSRCV